MLRPAVAWASCGLLHHQDFFKVQRGCHDAEPHGRYLPGGPVWTDEVVLQQMHVQGALQGSGVLGIGVGSTPKGAVAPA